MKTKIKVTKKVRNLAEALPSNSHLAFNEILNQLKEKECLPGEVKVTEQHSVYLLTPTGELVFIHRKKSRRLWQEVLLVTVVDLKPSEVFRNLVMAELVNSQSNSKEMQSFAPSFFQTIVKAMEAAERTKLWSEITFAVIGVSMGLFLILNSQLSLADKLPKRTIPVQQPSQDLKSSSQPR